MINSKLKTMSSFATIGLLALCETSAQAATPTCYSRAATHYITSLSQLTPVPNRAFTTYALVGTTSNDTVVIEIAAPLASDPVVIEVKLAEPGTVGGYDYVCVNSELFYLDVSGAKYLKSQGIDYVKASKLRDYSYVELDGAGYVSTGNGDNTVVINDSRNSAHSTTTVYGGKGNDEILITTSVNVVVNSGAGDDRINIDLRTRDDGLTVPAAINAGSGDDLVAIVLGAPGARSFVVGGEGDDMIFTGDGSDLIYGSEVSYTGESLDNITINNFNDATSAFFRSSANELRSYLSPLYSDDTAGGDISTNSGNDYIYGTNGTDYLRGGSGNDYIKGYGARDRMWGDSGNDKLYGGDGNDTLEGGSGTDTCSGDAGDDTITGCP